MEPAKKKKLLIVITKSNFGGAQRYVYDLSRSLKDTYEVVVACGGEGLMKKHIEEAGIQTISIPFLQRNINPFKDIAVFFWMIRVIQREKPVIVHSNSSKMGGITAAAVSIAGGKHIKSVFTAHAWAFNENRNSLSKGSGRIT